MPYKAVIIYFEKPDFTIETKEFVVMQIDGTIGGFQDLNAIVCVNYFYPPPFGLLAVLAVHLI